MLRPIVIVEDNPHDLELMTIALGKANLGNDLIVLRDGAEALDYLSNTGKWQIKERIPPAVVLLDLKLPKRSGLEILEHIKSDPQLRHVPVVMLTSSREESDVERSYRLGVNAYVVKPMHFHDFTLAVQELGGFWAVRNEPPPGTLRIAERAVPGESTRVEGE